MRLLKASDTLTNKLCHSDETAQFFSKIEKELMTSTPTKRENVSFVIPVYNEQDVLKLLFSRMDAILDQLDGKADVIFVNDGSQDGSLDLITEKAADSRYSVVNLSRNFGHQIAITAGVERATGDAVIIMDADLQDPPEVALEMVARWKAGYDVVSARRAQRKGETAFKRWSASLYYRILSKISPVDIPPDVGDFRLIDRKVADALRAMPEQDRYFRGMVSWVGFKQTQVAYERHERAAGGSKYSLKAMFQLASNGILGFSDMPLRIALWFGLAIAMISFMVAMFVFVGWLLGGSMVPGWASTMLLFSFLSGVQLLTLGIVGLYVGRIYNEAKGRPLYFVDPEPSIKPHLDSQISVTGTDRLPQENSLAK